MTTRIRLSFGVLFFGILQFIGCTRASTISSGSKFVVLVVGDGVSGDCLHDDIRREYPLNRAQGQAMWKGAQAAYQHSPKWESLREQVEVQPCDDKGVAAEAKAIALSSRITPQVLAVIGHATSGTTRNAAPIYASANIPVLMPIATSPNVFFDEQSRRRPNLFRLPPSDDLAQAPAVAYTALRLLNAQHIYIIRDVSEDAAEYSGPLFDGILKLIGDKKLDDEEVNRKQTSIHDVARNVRAQGADLVIFVGYGTTAKLILSDIDSEYSRLKHPPPPVLLTDGCKIVDLNPSQSLEVYVSFPVPDMTSLSCKSKEMDIFRQYGGGDQSYEMYGYDAMLILAEAITACEHNPRISRECIRGVLAQREQFAGACLYYAFRGGENRKSPIYIYRVVPDSPVVTKYAKQWVIQPEDWLRLEQGQD